MSAGFIQIVAEGLRKAARKLIDNQLKKAIATHTNSDAQSAVTLLINVVRLAAIWFYHVGLNRWLATRVHWKTSQEPPAFAETILLLFVKKKYRDSLAVTLAEEFERRLETGCSPKRARRLYWTSVINSLGPQIMAFARRHGMKLVNWIGAAGFIEEVVRRLTH